ncbi:hypothetical protein Cni_G20143 [Canna indica]|uniref:Uncharacterized protein n=1 Tax=Canna indica TaxID=4628 RepID=A0AAQ3KSP2_9LILI|nr:hypothetical protein Cni_G20143 [Canna indica]
MRGTKQTNRAAYDVATRSLYSDCARLNLSPPPVVDTYYLILHSQDSRLNVAVEHRESVMSLEGSPAMGGECKYQGRDAAMDADGWLLLDSILQLSSSIAH